MHQAVGSSHQKARLERSLRLFMSQHETRRQMGLAPIPSSWWPHTCLDLMATVIKAKEGEIIDDPVDWTSRWPEEDYCRAEVFRNPVRRDRGQRSGNWGDATGKPSTPYTLLLIQACELTVLFLLITPPHADLTAQTHSYSQSSSRDRTTAELHANTI